MRPVDLVLFTPLGLIASIVLPICLPNLYTLLPILFYGILNIVVSLFIALAMNHKIRTFFYLMLIFPTMHISYGVGSLLGLIRLALGVQPKPGTSEVSVKLAKELGS